jgi:NAD(P)H-dependent FMN reductase
VAAASVWLARSVVALRILIASTRPGRLGPTVAQWVLEQVPDTGFEVELLDLADVALPFLDEPKEPSEGDYVHEHTRRWAETIRATEALLIVMPEYNRGYSAPLKNAIDFLYAEWEGLPVACVGYGWYGARHAKAALRQTLERVKMTVVEAPGLAFGSTLVDGEVVADADLLADLAKTFEGLRDAAAQSTRKRS